MMIASKLEIDEFLDLFKQKIKVFDIIFESRIENLDTLLALEINPDQRIEYLHKLTHNNYFRGPEKDVVVVKRREYWEFGMEIKGKEVYIKISIGEENREAVCISFHIARRKIVYPYK